MPVESRTAAAVENNGPAPVGRLRLPLLYALLAIIATATNLAAQELAIRLYSGASSLGFAVIVGTAVGLVVKYILDKRYIFAFRARDVTHDGQTFMLYTITGIATTAIFWGFEFGFDYLFSTREARYLGAIIGLSIGYIAKYQLDKRFVFRTSAG